jgi:hypothetical protein
MDGRVAVQWARFNAQPGGAGIDLHVSCDRLQLRAIDKALSIQGCKEWQQSKGGCAAERFGWLLSFKKPPPVFL